MSNLFIYIFNMSVAAGIAACAVMLVRLPLKKAPKVFSYALWTVVLFRLLCPFTFESTLSAMPAGTSTTPSNSFYSQTPALQSHIAAFDDTVNAALLQASPSNSFAFSSSLSSGNTPIHIILEIASWIWLAGSLLLLCYAAFSYFRLKHRLGTATLVRENIYETDRILTPFVLGFIRPRIYLPAGMTDSAHILLHEQTHIRRKDYLIKPVAFLALCLHWFNPIIWISYYLMNKDMEMSCDESVLRCSERDIRKDYSGSLLALSIKQSGLLSPLAFGESNTKTRVKNVLRYKKPARLATILAMIAVLIVTTGFAADRVQGLPIQENTVKELDWRWGNMRYDRVSFGDNRDWIIYRMGREPDSEEVFPDGSSKLFYRMTVRSGPDPATAKITSVTEVTFYLNDPACVEKKGMLGVYLIDVFGGCEMTGIREIADGTLAGVLAEYGEPHFIEQGKNSELYWYYDTSDTDRRMWFEVKDGELTQHMGIICQPSHAETPADEAVVQLIDSMTYNAHEYGDELYFQIPPHFYRPGGWNIHIAGRSEYVDGFSTSLHYLEEENENHMWEAGKWYTIHLEDYTTPVKVKTITDLTIDISLPDKNGKLIEKSADLLKIVRDAREKTGSTEISDNTIANLYFLSSADGAAFRAVSHKAVLAFLSADRYEMAKYLLDPTVAAWTVREMTDMLDQVESIRLNWNSDNLKSSDEIGTSYLFTLKGEDSVSYVSMELVKVNGEWKVRWIGIEK